MPERNALDLYPAASHSATSLVWCCSPTSSVPARFAFPYTTLHPSYQQPSPLRGGGSPSVWGSHRQACWFPRERLSLSRSLLSLKQAWIALWGERETRSLTDYCPSTVKSKLSAFNLSLWTVIVPDLTKPIYIAASVRMACRSLSSTSVYYQQIWNIKMSCWTDKIHFP